MQEECKLLKNSEPDIYAEINCTQVSPVANRITDSKPKKKYLNSIIKR